MADAKSLTVHASQGKAAPQHDKREYTPPNACRALEANNVCVVRVEDEVQAFNDFFQPHVEAFNEKQKRADRKKSLDYHAEVVERRAKSKDPDHETKPFYEYVIGVGDRNGVMGVTDSEFDNDHWRRLKDGYTDEDGNEVAPDYKAADEYVMAHLNDHPDREGLKRALTEYMEGLQERYPNFQFVSNEGHDDEPNGTFHFHVRFFPVADGYKKGMETRCGLNKALAAMGFSGGDQLPITQWQNDVKNGLEEVLKECGYEREYGDGRKYRLDTASYVLSENLEELALETDEVVAGFEALRDTAMLEEAEATMRASVAAANADEQEARAAAAEAKVDANVKSLELMRGEEFEWKGKTVKGSAGLRKERDELEGQISGKREDLQKLTELAEALEKSTKDAQQDEGSDELTKFKRYIQSEDFGKVHPIAAKALAPVMEIIEEAMKLYRQRQTMQRKTLREQLTEAEEAMKPKRNEMLSRQRRISDGAPSAHPSEHDMGIGE